jgi:hypothetical protein
MTDNPYAGTDNEGAWADGYQYGQQNPNDSSPSAPSPYADDSATIWREGALAGQQDALANQPSPLIPRQVTADDILLGLHALSTAGELLEIFGKFPEALEDWVQPVGGVLMVISMLINTIAALETEERGAGYRGTAYGLVYGALGMGTPSATCSGSLGGADQDTLNQDAFNKAASEAANQMSDTVSRNRVLVRIEKDLGDPGVTVNCLYQALCANSDDTQLAAAYSSLPWPNPVCA